MVSLLPGEVFEFIWLRASSPQSTWHQHKAHCACDFQVVTDFQTGGIALYISARTEHARIITGRCVCKAQALIKRKLALSASGAILRFEMWLAKGLDM